MDSAITTCNSIEFLKAGKTITNPQTNSDKCNKETPVASLRDNFVKMKVIK